MIKTAQERLKEFTLDTHNAPAYLVVGCQNAEIVELRLELDKLKNQDSDTDLLSAFDTYARQFTYRNHPADPSHFPTGYRWFKAGYLAQQEARK